MSAFSGFARRLFGSQSGVKLQEKALPEPEAVNAAARPMTGFFATLSAAQKERVLAYRGSDNVGNDKFPKIAS